MDTKEFPRTLLLVMNYLSCFHNCQFSPSIPLPPPTPYQFPLLITISLGYSYSPGGGSTLSLFHLTYLSYLTSLLCTSLTTFFQRYILCINLPRLTIHLPYITPPPSCTFSQRYPTLFFFFWCILRLSPPIPIFTLLMNIIIPLILHSVLWC